MSDETLIKHFNLLQQEFQKINTKYQLLKYKYDQLTVLTGNGTTEDNFLINLNKIIRGLYKDKKYSDISIKLQNSKIPGHKIVFEANGGDWTALGISSCDEINLENEEQFIGEQVVKWLYLQEFNDNQSHEILWKIMKIAHEHSLYYLKNRCENGLLLKLSKDNCIYFYMKASEFAVENLKKFCSDLIISNWNEYQLKDFNGLGASIFLELLKLQSDFPLHVAVKANRDDVVFLYINENFSQLEELVNIISDDNEIVLDLALSSKRVELCQILLANCANPNSVDKNGWSLLHKAVLRWDEFSACFLIQNGCHLNPLSPELLQTPLQMIAHLTSDAKNIENYAKISKIATLLIQNDADVNHADINEMTPLCFSILSGNEMIMKAILDSGRCTTINGINSWRPKKNKCRNSSTLSNNNQVSSNIKVPPLPLWLAVCREYRPELLEIYKEFRKNASGTFNPTSMLIENDADPNCLYDAESGNSILHEIISQRMEDAAIFVLEAFNNRHKTKSIQTVHNHCIEFLVNNTNNCKESLLHLAVENELTNLSKLLFQLGADPNMIRRKPISSPIQFIKDDQFSSCDSLDSSLSLKEYPEVLSSNNHDVVNPVFNNSTDAVNWSSKTDNLNPFKDFMKHDSDDITSISLPAIHKHNTLLPSFVDLVLNKKQDKDTKRYSHRCKSKTLNDKQFSVDLCTPTHLAIKTKNVKMINLFIDYNDENGYHVNWLINDVYGESPFTLTLWNELISIADKIFRILIKNSFKATDIDQIVIDGQHLLHSAVLKNNIETVQFLVKIGCDINIKSPDGITPLQLACEKFYLEIIRILCLSGADPNVTYIDSCSESNSGPICPLWVALTSNRFDIAEILTEAGADVDMWLTDPRDDYDQSLVHRTILERKEKAAIFLISQNCNIRSPRENRNLEARQISSVLQYIDGNTPLHMACQIGLPNVVESLLCSNDIDVNAQNIHGHTSLHLAIKFQHEAVLTHLLNPRFKLNLSIRDSQGHTPFHTSMETSNQKAARAILKYHPSAADEVDNLGRNFLHVAIQAMNKEAVFFLIQVNANLNFRVKDSFQYTPLHLAIINGAPEDMIRSLILAGARIEEVTLEKQNLLHLAVIYERTYLISFLLENGASTSHQDHQYETPIHVAIRGGNKDLIEALLLSSSSTIRNKNLKGENILHILSNNAKENAVVIFSFIMDHYPDFPMDEKDACGNTALFLCACNGHDRLGISMLTKGATLGCVNNDGSTLFNCELITEQLLLKFLDALDIEPNWLDGEACVSCLCKFSIKNRKHHCRHCGRLVCGKCSVNEIPIIKFHIKKPVRVCNICFNFIVNRKVQ